jgi:hypothetical protein
VNAPPHSGLSLAPTSSYKHPFLQNRSLLDGQESKASLVDDSTGSHVEDTCKKEDTGEEHRSNLKAERGRYPTKSIHYRIINRLASLRVFRKVAGKHPGYGY